MPLRPRGGPPKRFGSLVEHPATPRLEKSQGLAPQPPSARRPRRTGQPQRARGRSPSARSRFAAPITPAPQASCRITQARRRLPGRRSPRLPFHRARLPCGAIAPRGGSARGDSAAAPRMRPCGGWKGPGLRSAAHAPLARAAKPRPPQVPARIAGADCARSHPRLRSEPEGAAQARLRGAGDSESAVRRIGAPLPRARRRTACASATAALTGAAGGATAQQSAAALCRLALGPAILVLPTTAAQRGGIHTRRGCSQHGSFHCRAVDLAQRAGSGKAANRLTLALPGSLYLEVEIGNRPRAEHPFYF